MAPVYSDVTVVMSLVMSAIPFFYCSLCSGILDVRKLLGMGMKIGMGTGT